MSSSFSAEETETFVTKRCPPPLLPVDRVYTANYCEENIYLLVKRLLQDEQVRAGWCVYAVFISNNTRTVALWSQKIREDVVVWDYHVILALKPRVSRTSAGREFGHDDELVSMPVLTGSPIWIYDLDTRLDVPCRWEDYVKRTFPYSTPEAAEDGWTIPDTYWSHFRVVEGEEFLECFASDRSHMLVPGSDPPHYHSPEPPYPPIVGTKAAALGRTNNLMSHFVCMDVENREIGRVLTLEQVKELFI
ncbi:hypothetical protein ACEPAH_4749 [Sanghuangporus vaninii]